eukprot:TRINITY_DN14723_c0_g1_i1.p1 TRINITY_DN14723_c0_g1~~TRINITY_DN14723_c0_g1_i1.p1  ORF type:complete len:203 (+),score=40.88 TRINITY_DN14723_c0_g1_i1:154-762(+)
MRSVQMDTASILMLVFIVLDVAMLVSMSFYSVLTVTTPFGDKYGLILASISLVAVMIGLYGVIKKNANAAIIYAVSLVLDSLASLVLSIGMFVNDGVLEGIFPIVFSGFSISGAGLALFFVKKHAFVNRDGEIIQRETSYLPLEIEEQQVRINRPSFTFLYPQFADFASATEMGPDYESGPQFVTASQTSPRLQREHQDVTL